MVPHLVTALKGPLLELERRMLEATPRIERWFRLEWQEHTPPFCGAVDLRNAGFKLAPIDTDLFPDGFGRLSVQTLPLAVQASVAAIEKYCPDARNLLLLPRRGALDADALENVGRLMRILRQTGLNVRLGALDPAVRAPQPLVMPDGRRLALEPLVRHGRRLGLANFEPCAVLINDDLAGGVPEALVGLDEQVVLPPLHAGWQVRRRSNHGVAYAEVTKRFAKLLDIDPWLIAPLHALPAPVAVGPREADQNLARSVDSLLRQIRAKYREYRIDQPPFVVVKDDAGAGASRVRTVRDAAEILDRRAGAGTERPPGTVFVQEGVHTSETVDAAGAEPVVCAIDRFVVGGFYRVHAARGPDESLSAPGATFVPLPFATSCVVPETDAPPGVAANRFYAYGVIARLALLAASIELERTDPDPARYGL